ncbi:hypothetical protein QJU96_09835 [Pasteurella skyensis]|nr:hypothetical protein [Pasteurella skyensis]
MQLHSLRDSLAPNYCSLVTLSQDDEDLFKKYIPMHSFIEHNYIEEPLSAPHLSQNSVDSESYIKKPKKVNAKPIKTSNQSLVQEGSKQTPLKLVVLVVIIAVLLFVLGIFS